MLTMTSIFLICVALGSWDSLAKQGYTAGRPLLLLVGSVLVALPLCREYINIAGNHYWKFPDVKQTAEPSRKRAQ
jgi:hypothetical protein